MQTRSKSGVVKPYIHPTLLAADLALKKTIKQALCYPHWFSAMKEEFLALQCNKTRTLVPVPHIELP